MNRNIIVGLGVFAFLVLIGCFEETKQAPFVKEIMEIKKEFAPDKRVALFDISSEQKEDAVFLRGESNLPDAISALKEKLNTANISVIDSIQLLPAVELQGKTNAVINISVANLRSNPKHSAELATQATLGTPVKVLKREGGWYFIQTPDKYLSWVDEGGMTLMHTERFEQWQGADKIIYQNIYGHAYAGEDEEQTVSDLVSGNILEILRETANHFVVHYPDGRQGLVRKIEAQRFDEWLKNLDPNVDNLVASSKKLMGVPYLWGGTSTKGMDCSGFTKTIYFLNGMVIPRDASQQVHTGQAVDSTLNFENLKKGDLLFFGTKATDSTKEKVVHVGMWMGNNEFIHASNMVRISSMDPNAENFDEWNRNRYLRTKRILKEEDDALINLKQTPLFKD